MFSSVISKRLKLIPELFVPLFSYSKWPQSKTCSVEPQIPQWLSHDLSHLGSSPTTLTVRRKELRMGGDGCVPPPTPPPASRCLVSAEIWGLKLTCAVNKRKKLTNQIIIKQTLTDKKKIEISDVCRTSDDSPLWQLSREEGFSLRSLSRWKWKFLSCVKM